MVPLYRWVERRLIRAGVSPDNADWAATASIAVGVLLLALIANQIARRFILRGIGVIVRRTEVTWDHRLLERRVFDPLSHLAPGVIFFTLLPIAFPHVEGAKDLIRRASLAYMTIVVASVFDRLTTAAVEIYEVFEIARHRPLKSYAQLLKILNYVIAGILLVSIALGQSPLVLLGTLGALSAVLLFVFKDPLLGLVASVQLSANNMVQRGDPIEVPKYGIEGDVVDMSLTTVKVQHADKTISTIPNYTLVSESFRNMRGIREAGVRRVKRALYLDIYSVRFFGKQRLEQLLGQAAIAARLPDLATRFGPDQPTNLGVFRAYVEACARAQPKVAADMPLLVRQLAPGERGIGIELTAYVRELDFAEFEALQARLFEHLIAIVPEFELRLFQNPMGGVPEAASASQGES